VKSADLVAPIWWAAVAGPGGTFAFCKPWLLGIPGGSGSPAMVRATSTPPQAPDPLHQLGSSGSAEPGERSQRFWGSTDLGGRSSISSSSSDASSMEENPPHRLPLPTERPTRRAAEQQTRALHRAPGQPHESSWGDARWGKPVRRPSECALKPLIAEGTWPPRALASLFLLCEVEVYGIL